MFVPPTPPDSPRGILCPKCSYDLRGTMGDWSRACPLRGVCPECGLQFEWAEMIGEKSGPVGRAADAISDLLGVPRSRQEVGTPLTLNGTGRRRSHHELSYNTFSHN